MAAIKPPRLVKWEGDWHIFYRDLTRPDANGRPKARRMKCTANGASTPPQRKALLKRISHEQNLARVNKELGIEVEGYHCRFLDEVDNYLQDVVDRRELRTSNPQLNLGIAKGTAKRYLEIGREFRAWLMAKYEHIKTSELSSTHLTKFINVYATTPNKTTGAHRSASTVNTAIKVVQACVNFIDLQEPPRFKSVVRLLRGLKPLEVTLKDRAKFKPPELVAVAESMLEEDSRREILNTISRDRLCLLFLMYALCGARNGEIMALKWSDIDLDTGRIRIYGAKTKRYRKLPLVGAPEGDIAPKLVELLRLIGSSSSEPSQSSALLFQCVTKGKVKPNRFPVEPWKRAADVAGVDVMPQKLRQNFTSYAASLGIPASVCAMWQGHTAAVAESNYRTILDERLEGKTFESAMGLDVVIDRLISTITFAAL